MLAAVQVVAQSDASASGMYTDKPVPNAFWRAFSAFLYVVPILDTWRLGVRNYDVLFPTIAIRNFAGAPPAPPAPSCSHAWLPLSDEPGRACVSVTM